MFDVLQNLAPQALILLIGYLAVTTRWFSELSLKGLSKFAYNFAIPVMLFKMMASLELPDMPPLDIWLSYFSATLLTLGIVAFFTIRTFNISRAAGASYAIAGTFSNSVVLGIPFHLSVIGPEASFTVFTLISLHAVVLLISATLIAESVNGGSIAITLLHTTRDTLRNPIIIGLVAGLVWGIFDLPLPQIIAQTADKISAAALPLAVFALGGTLAGLKFKGNWSQISAVMAAKLILHPVIVAFMVLVVFKLPTIPAAVLILNACLPTGINAFLFAAHYQQVEKNVAGVILVSTPVSLLLYAAVATLLLP